MMFPLVGKPQGVSLNCLLRCLVHPFLSQLLVFCNVGMCKEYHIDRRIFGALMVENIKIYIF